MSWIIYAIACVFLYGIMQFFIKLSSNSNAIASSLVFVTAQFVAQLSWELTLFQRADLI